MKFFQINAKVTEIQMLPIISIVILKQKAKSLGLSLSSQTLFKEGLREL